MTHTNNSPLQKPGWPARLLAGLAAAPLAALLLLAFLSLYVRTAAPSVLSGDSAEFQLAAPLLGVPHPTTYPLYVLLGKLATLALPFGDLAWRVTIVSAACAALTVALFFLLARRITGSAPAALVGSLALGLAPGLWNAATMAEVYALLAALLAALAYLIVADRRPPTAGQRSITAKQQAARDTVSWRPRLAAFVGGLGCTHHGLFVLIGMPLLAWFLLGPIVRSPAGAQPRLARGHARQLGLLALCFSAGLLPWLYPLAQYARYGPFAGEDYGLPRHYFWGAPASWGQVFDLLGGGPMRRDIFRPPALQAMAATLGMVGRRLLFEFGPIGVPLGLFGSILLARRARRAWLGAAWIFFATLAYLLLLGPAVQDAPVFTLPMMLPWSLWIAAGSAALIELADGWRRARTEDRGLRIEGEGREIRNGGWAMGDGGRPNKALSSFVVRGSSFVVALLVAATLAWGYTRVQVSSKRQLWLFRRFGEETLNQLPPRAVVLTHWEQGMTLQYLIQVEGRRPDVWVDVVEPGDSGWGDRARRYPGRAVFFVGARADVNGLPIKLVREHEYADVFELQK